MDCSAWAALGVAILSSVLAGVGVTEAVAGGGESPHVVAYRWAFLVAAAIALVGAALAFAVPDADAAASMKIRGREKAPGIGAELEAAGH